MPSPNTDDADRTPSRSALLAAIGAGRHGDARAALDKVTASVPALEKSADRELLLIGLWGQAELMGRADFPFREVAATCDLLEQAAQERLAPLWVAVARALRTTVRLDAGDVSACVADLARIELDQLGDGLSSVGGSQLLDLLATAYGRLRLHDQADDVRARAELSLSARKPLDRAIHWAHRATDLAVRAMEPVSTGADEPDLRLLQQAAEFADQLSTVPPDLVPDRLRRGADAVRALEAAFRGRPAEALRLLGEDGFRPPADLPGLERRLAMIAAMHAQALIGAVEVARRLDRTGDEPPPSLPYLVLDVCRAVERLRLESHNDGNPVPALHRVNDLLVRLGRTGMDLVGETARQALEHQALRVENRTDALTGVGNRRALDEEVRSMLRFSQLPLSLLLVDLDDFKAVNDRFTHVVGDEVLRRVAKALSQQLRGGDRLVRYGGDEFVVLLPLTSDTEADSVATRMVDAIQALQWDETADGLAVRITTGCGTLWSLSHRRPDGDAEHLFRLADEQLLQAKRRRQEPPSATSIARHGAATPAQPAAQPEQPAEPAKVPAELAKVPAPPAPPVKPAPPAPPRSPLTGAITLPVTGSVPVLYQALLQDPPRIDPHLGLLPPLGITPFTADEAFAPSAPEPTSEVASEVASKPAERPSDKPSRRRSQKQPSGPQHTSDRPEAPAGSGSTGSDQSSIHQEPETPRVRSRRRPNVIDLNAIEKRRSPFG